jgi:hypothetical protein
MTGGTPLGGRLEDPESSGTFGTFDTRRAFSKFTSVELRRAIGKLADPLKFTQPPATHFRLSVTAGKV